MLSKQIYEERKKQFEKLIKQVENNESNEIYFDSVGK